MNNLTSSERLFFSRALQSSLVKITSLLTAFFQCSPCKDQMVPLQLLKGGTILARTIEHVQAPEQCRKLLSKFYKLIVKQKSRVEENGIHEYEIHRLRFLVAYIHCNAAITNKVTPVIEVFLNQTAEIATSYIHTDSRRQRDSRTPDYLQYDYLMLLAELWQFLHNAEAYDRLKSYCTVELQGTLYYKFCCRHRLIGILAMLPPPLKEISEDILLQHLYRSNFLDSTLKDDPWRLMEQMCLHQFIAPDTTVFRFVTSLFHQLIEDHNDSTRYTGGINPDLDNNTLTLTNALLLYILSCKKGTYSAQHLLPDLGKSIWDTHSVLKITDGKLLPELSSSKQYTMGTYIFDQITKGTLFFFPDNNWSKRYRYGSRVLKKPFSHGATTVMTSAPPKTTTPPNQFLLVRNTFTAMLKLALENRKRYNGKVIGITGSVGKTTTASMIDETLAHFGRSYRNFSYFNHQTGVPKSVANIPQESDYAIIEMGMGRPGTILPKSVLARPHIVIVTEIQHDHMEFHDSINSVIKTKLEIADGLEPDGLVILNRDSKYFANMLGVLHAKGISRITTFGEHPLADIHAMSIKLYPDSSEIDVEIGGTSSQYKLSLPGIHMALNSLAVLAVLHELHIDLQQALLQFQTLLPVSGRNEIFELSLGEGKTVQIVDDSFNANPASMRSSFHVLSLMKPNNKGRRIMVVGDMGELGEKTKEYHEALADDVNLSQIDIFYSIGEYSYYLNNKIKDAIDHRHFNTDIELQNALVEILKNGDIISFKGSARTGDIKKIIKYLKMRESSPYQSVNP